MTYLLRMGNLVRAVLVVALFLFFSACGDHGSVQRLDNELNKVLSPSVGPGLSIAVTRDNGLIANGVAGVRRLGTKNLIMIDDEFHVGSVTKPFTATLAGMLVAEGRIKWDSKISEIMPEWKSEMRPEYLDVTLADLLSHEAGIPPFTDDSEFKGLKFSGDPRTQRREFVRHVLTMAPAAPRGTFLYSNAGFSVAAVMMEQVTNHSWEELIQTRIADPLKMKTLGFGWPKGANQPWGHLWEDGKFKPNDPNGDYQLPAAIAPAGDLHMSMDDLAKFLADQLRALRGESALIPPAIAKTMHTRRTRSGLGFGVSKVGKLEPVSTYTGSAGTFVTLIAIAPKANVAVAVSANGENDPTETALKHLLIENLTRYAVSKPH